MLPDLFEVGAMTPGTPAVEHKLFSVTHPDVDETDVPADEDVATFDAALGKWKAKPAAGGVTDHGLLDNLHLDHHEQYALADKSRPSPWVAAGDLAARSIADLGTKGHGLLADLGLDHHTQYALLSGRSGGQSLIGGLAAGEHVTLQATAHATRGYVRAQDDLQLLSDILRGSDGVNRLQLAAASPHLLFTGDQELSGSLGIRGTTPDAAIGLKLNNVPTGGFTGINLDSLCHLTTDTQSVYGLVGLATARAYDGTTGHLLRGLTFEARGVSIASSDTINELTGAYIEAAVLAVSSGTLTLPKSRGLCIGSGWGMKTGTAVIDWPDHRQLDIEASALPWMDALYGIRVADQLVGLVSNHIAWFGDATPQMSIDGGAYAVADKTAMVLNVNGTRYRVIRNAGTGALETEAA